MAVAALALDGLGDEARDVVRVCVECRTGLAQRLGFQAVHSGSGQAGPEVRRVDARPVELREAGHSDRIGVGQRQRVAAAAVERTAQVQHPGAECRVDAAGLVMPALPVERDLKRVLHRQRAALDEEQMRQRRVAQDPGEGLDEVGHRHRVDVGVTGLVQRRLSKFGAELLVFGQRRMVHTQRRRREEGEHVQVAPAVSGIDQIRPGRRVRSSTRSKPSTRMLRASTS